MPITIEPLTGNLWDDFARLFGSQGACYGCWCTYFRLPPKARQGTTADERRETMRRRVEAGPPPGLLAYDGAEPVGWMQIGPRMDIPEWNNAGRASAPLAAADARDPRCWAISCFFFRKSARRSGLSHIMVDAGVAHARASGARVLEACPMEEARTSGSIGLFVGSARVFRRAGFAEVAQRQPGRPLLRLDL